MSLHVRAARRFATPHGCGKTIVHTIWTEELEARLREAWENDEPTGAIAQVLGLTRNQVLAKARRMNLAARGGPAPIERARQRRIQQGLPAGQPARVGCLWIAGRDYLARLRAGEDVYCGKPTVNDAPWCVDHLLAAYETKPGYLTPEQSRIFGLRRKSGLDRRDALLEALFATAGAAVA